MILPSAALLVSLVAVPPMIIWRGETEIAAGGGERGPWRQNESRYRYVDDPTVVIDEHGEIGVAWVDQARKDVLFERLHADGSPQTQAVNVSRSGTTFSWLPRLAIVPQAHERILALWQEIIFSGGSHGGEIYFAASQDGGQSFSTPINLSNSRAGDGKGRISTEVWDNGSLDIAAGSQDAVFAAWTEYEGRLWLSRSSDGGQHFSAPIRVAGGPGSEPARAPSLAVDPEGAVYLAWTAGDNPSADIHLAKSTDAGQSFSEPKLIHPSKGYSDAPKLAIGSDGVLHLVYAESDGGPFARYHVRYTASADGGRTFAAARDLTNPAAGAAFPEVGVDGNNNIYIVSELFRRLRWRPQGLALTISIDGGRTFGEGRAVPGSTDPSGALNGSYQGLLMKKLAVNSGGALAIANSSLKEGERSRVWIIRGNRPQR